MGLCVFWAIWKGRNDVVFNRDKFNVSGVIQEVMHWYNMKMEVDIDVEQPTENDVLEAQQEQWEPPNGEKIKINFDGAAGKKGFACGAIARDSTGKVQCCQNRIVEYCTPVEVEAYSA
ncbi:uncharacterized protein LOC113312400 [Papaver somniferum]|uniref:uncharacterized protein LOC113312400 n=1 Tax=Papaver somniferum TaxID=3469 RepID=UPI000E6F7A67|nr:uncharacterized protein LOC113312400 [Papaver somniferum]